jgi:hypothetical protein
MNASNKQSERRHQQHMSAALSTWRPLYPQPEVKQDLAGNEHFDQQFLVDLYIKLDCEDEEQL